jgi:transcriptional regulator GlxA family with amidase domain
MREEESAMNKLFTGLPSHEPAQPRRIGVLIYPDCDIVDMCGPCEAFHWAGTWLPWFGKTGEHGYQCDILAATPGPIRTLSGIEVAATQSFHDIVDGLDTLVVAGGQFEQVCKDTALVEWVHSIAPRVRRVTSVCTGAFILAAAGLLDNRRATTHWMFSELLATQYPLVEVDANLLCVRDGNIYTSGGITAGIDLALALVEEDLGREVALAAARMMVVFPSRPGGQSQFSAYVKYR